jgi:hypothetical protein
MMSVPKAAARRHAFARGFTVLGQSPRRTNPSHFDELNAPQDDRPSAEPFTGKPHQWPQMQFDEDE